MGKVVQAEGRGGGKPCFPALRVSIATVQPESDGPGAKAGGSHRSHNPAVTSHLLGHLVKLLFHDNHVIQ